MQLILEANTILMVMAYKIIQYFNQCKNILNGWVVGIVKPLHENQKDCLIKKITYIVKSSNPQTYHIVMLELHYNLVETL